MKNIITISAFLVFVSGFGQAFPKFTYQAVVRNSTNELIIDTTVGMRISILQNTVDGTVVFSEVQNPTTNGNGLATLVIGDGIGDIGSTSVIDWKAGPYFIKTQIDPLNGTNYTIEATSQLLSVPYAMYAAKSATAETVSLVSAGFTSLLTSTVRNTNVYSTESLTIPQSGYYLISFSGIGYLSDVSTEPLDSDFDIGGYAFIYSEALGGVISDFLPMGTSIVQSDSGFYRRFLPMPIAQTFTAYLNAGTVLRCGANISSTGTPTAGWQINNVRVTAVKLQ